MTPEEQRALYDAADTPEQARDLLVARGMPELANMAYTMMRYMTPISVPPFWRKVAERAEAGEIPGTAPAYREKPLPDVARALRWLERVAERGMVKASEGWPARRQAMDDGADRMDLREPPAPRPSRRRRAA